jgi:PAS domain S-box-containing protein
MKKKLREPGAETTGNERVEDLLNQAEQYIRLENISSPSRKIKEKGLAEIIDVQAVQSLMEDFYKLARIPMCLEDLEGNILVGVGWQDICIRYHRADPETCKRCIENSAKLAEGIAPGEFKLCRCRNSMWKMVTPIIVSDQHVGNIFSGHFFFDDEPLDYEFFRARAGKYGFNEKEYIEALEKVPRLSREAVNTGMSFFMKFASMVLQVSYSNFRLYQALEERNVLMNSLRESEEKCRSFLEAANEGIWIINAEDKTIYVNKKMSGMLGYTQQEMIGRPGWDFIDEKDRCVSEKIREKKHQDIDESHEFKFICKDGSPLWALVNTKSFFDRDGNFAGCIWMFTDITDRKQAEEALIRRENEFRTLAENSPDIIARYDRQKRYIYVNPAAAEPSGYSPEEIMGKNSIELGIDPETTKFWEESIENVFITGKPETIEFNYMSPEGKDYYFNTQLVPEFIDEKVNSVLAISRDITDKKIAEAKLKETLENLERLVRKRTAELEKAYYSLKESEKGLAEAQEMAHIGNWEWDIAANKTYWSEEMYHIFGRDTNRPAPVYTEHLNYIHPDDRDYFDSSTRKAESEKTSSIEYRIVLDSGEERTVHMRAQAVFNEENIPIKVKGTVQDITERKKAEQALVNLEIARKKEIHHRIKNNLQVISSLLDLQAENFSSKTCIKNSDVLNAFRESQDRIMSIALIHEELHEGGGNNALYFSPYLEKLVENLFQTYSLGNASISLYTDLEEDIFFDMDTAVPLGIIVNELVSNSLKHAFKGRSEGEIQIKLFKEGSGGEEKTESGMEKNKKRPAGKDTGTADTGYVLVVSDDGAGIPETINLENSDSLGLQLVNILVDQLEGEIELKRDNGTEFMIKINVRQGSLKSQAEEKNSQN